MHSFGKVVDTYMYIHVVKLEPLVHIASSLFRVYYQPWSSYKPGHVRWMANII